MRTEIVIPRLGWSMEEGTFVEWLKQPGSTVTPGEPLFALESEKVTMEVEALDGGVLTLNPDSPPAGATVQVGQVIGHLDDGASPTAPPARAITPRARSAARELGIDPAQLTGTGREGRIRERDVRAAAPAKPAPSRATIARRMTESRDNTVPVTLVRRVDASRLTALRNRWKLALQPAPAPTINDIVVKLAAHALMAHPAMAGGLSTMHIGIAVDTPHGLIVPVLRNVPELSLTELAHQARGLIEAARERRLPAEAAADGVFTVTNLGSFGVETFNPVINPPQTAILGLGAILWEPVVLPSGEIVPRQRMALCLTFDHRAVDGAPAARFLADLARVIEEPPAAVHCA
ncbi:MAG: 2-oxo acid dehydrogenase subunit E2 [Acidobacteria bacterium]|nr:2-oxo acid dehydrogenase subunit E2 [Acidobacteriota bacterium]